jgi:TonB family protein
VFRNLIRPAMLERIRAAASTQPLGITSFLYEDFGMKVTLASLLLLFANISYVSQARVTEPAVVVSAVAPVYPAIAQAAKASGDIVVTVEINKSGGVTSARANSGHTLLHKVSVEAARRWKFSTSSEEHRQAQLTFTYRIVPEKTAGLDRTPVFYPPYRIEVRSEHLIVTTNYSR